MTRTALEIANKLDTWIAKDSREAAAMLRQQRAEIDRLRRERHHIYDLLARIHRDGGQYTAEHGVEKSCDDAEAQVVTWIDTIIGIDSLIEQARIAEREACAAICESRITPGTGSVAILRGAAEKIRARSAT